MTLPANNASAALWQSVTNIASLSGTSQTNMGNLFLPKTAESYTYDLDGNLTSDGRWTNKWDGENRLIDMTSHSNGPSGSRKSLQFAYDSKSRRYSKVVSNWTGSAWTRALHELYHYDGWNLLGALNGTNNAIIRSFLWGSDMSGSPQGAGGVGGLLFFTRHSTSPPSTHCAAYDGNGNVMALVDGSTGAASARYEYDPFGQTIRASGTAATLNPVRFSSKLIDDETDLAYYGYRYLNSNSGRWLSRDPAEEKHDVPLYVSIKNEPLSSFDWLGLLTVQRPIPEMEDSLDPQGTTVGLTTDYTQWEDPGLESCGPFLFGNRHKKLQVTVVIGVQYRGKKTEDFNGQPVQTHEFKHVNTYIQRWTLFEAEYNGIGQRCFCSVKCRMMRDSLLDLVDSLAGAWAQSWNDYHESTDYRGADQEQARIAYTSSRAAYLAIKADFDKKKANFENECK